MFIDKLINSKKIFLFIVFLIFFLGIFLRINNYAQIPQTGETYDEYMWTMLGDSLLKGETPKGWSYFSYKNVTPVDIFGSTLPGVTPFIDHPPLFALLPGFAQFIYNFSNTGFAPTSIIRIPSIILGIINFFLFFLLAKQMLSKKAQLVALSLYAIFPTLIIGSRLAQSENLLTTITLAIFVLFFSKTKFKINKNVILFLLFATLPLIKITGVAIGLIFLIIFFKKQQFKLALFGFLTGFILSLIYFISIDFNQYLTVFIQQGSNRHVGFASFFLFFIKNKIVSTFFYDGIFLAGILSYFYCSITFVKNEKVKALVTFTSLFIFYLLFASGETTSIYNNSFTGPSIYGWYKIPILPFLIIFLSLGLQQIYITYNKVLYMLFLILMMFFTRIILFADHFTKIEAGFSNNTIRLIYLLIFGSLLLPKKYWKYYFVFSFIITLLLGFYANLLLSNAFIIKDANYFGGI